jgi:predicted lactoylglutathione lyase
MKVDQATVCLSTEDRAVSHAFYTALGFEAIGVLGDDGIPEPLQFEISDGLRVMLIPTGGFGWVIGDRDRSPAGAHECMVAVGLPSEAEVDDLMRRARDAGAGIVYEAGNQSWGPGDHVDAYAGAFADPDGHLWQISRADGVLTR